MNLQIELILTFSLDAWLILLHSSSFSGKSSPHNVLGLALEREPQRERREIH